MADPRTDPVAGVLRVVGAAILRPRGDDAPGHEVLVAQRAHPVELAGKWEFPGGKVHPGESDRDALVRECAEELGVVIEAGDPIAGDIAILGGRATLRVLAAVLKSGEPTAREHLALRWIGSAEVASLDWLSSNRPLVAPLRSLLAGDLCR